MQFAQQQHGAGKGEGEGAAAYDAVGVDVNGRVWGSLGWESNVGEGLSPEDMRSAREASADSSDSLLTLDSVPEYRELQQQWGMCVMDHYNIDMDTHREVRRFYAYHAEQPFNSVRRGTMAHHMVGYLHVEHREGRSAYVLRGAMDQINQWWMASGRGSLLNQMPDVSRLLHMREA
jgi:hypothetical protein